MLPVPLLFPRLAARSEVVVGGAGHGGSSPVGLGSVSWKAEGSGSGRRLRIKEAKDSFEASVLMSLVVGGMLLGSWASLDGVDAGGGVGGRGRKKGIFRGDSSGSFDVLCDSASSSVAFTAVASAVLLLLRGSSMGNSFGLVAVAASKTLLFFGASAMCDASCAGVLSDEADADT